MKKLIFVLLIIIVSFLTSCNQTPDEVKVDISFTLNKGFDTIEINDSWLDEGAVLKAGDETFNVFTQTAVNTAELGTIEVIYGYTYLEIDYSISRIVTITDQTPPLVSILPGVDTIYVGDDWVDGGCSAVDNSSESVTCTLQGTVDSNTVGEYTVIYVSIDSSGNEGSATRIINVIEW